MKPTSPSLHPSAAIGFVQGAGSYVRGRPGYPAELSGWLRAALQLQAGKIALPSGPGTSSPERFFEGTIELHLSFERGRAQDALLEQLLRDTPAVRDIDIDAAARLFEASLPPLPVLRHG